MFKGLDISTLKFDDAIHRELTQIRSTDDVVKTTIHIPLWIRVSVARLHIEKGVSEGKLYTAIINHGASIIRDKYGAQIQGMEETRYKLLRSDNEFIKTLIGDFQISVNGVHGKNDRRTIRIPVWCKDYLGVVGSALRMEFPSIIRLAMYLSFQSCYTLTNKETGLCDESIVKFEQKFNGFEAVCNALVPIAEDEVVSI